MKTLKKSCLLLAFLLSTTLALAHPDKTISLNFQTIPVRKALQILAQYTDSNMIISPKITGEMSLHIKDIDWQQALNVILTTQGLAKRDINNVIYIAPANIIAEQNQMTDNASKNEPLVFRVIQLRYANAPAIAKLLHSQSDSLLSERGVVSVDQRTNSILIKDTQNNLDQISRLLRGLDIPVKQVMIAARIVNVDSDYEKELGIRFGLTAPRHLSGTLKGATEMTYKAPDQVNMADRLNIDMPAMAANAAHMGLALFQITKGTLVDLEISALESEGHANIISKPQLIASNQQPASIEAGQEIPYQEKSYGGNTSIAFKKAVLSLKVTPQIIPDGKIILHLQVNQDKRSSKEVLGVPAIDTRQITTDVLVNNKQTIVLGGIYEDTKTNNVDRVPFFSSIPVLGELFKHRKKLESRRELLIFVTPTIIQ